MEETPPAVVPGPERCEVKKQVRMDSLISKTFHLKTPTRRLEGGETTKKYAALQSSERASDERGEDISNEEKKEKLLK